MTFFFFLNCHWAVCLCRGDGDRESAEEAVSGYHQHAVLGRLQPVGSQFVVRCPSWTAGQTQHPHDRSSVMPQCGCFLPFWIDQIYMSWTTIPSLPIFQPLPRLAGRQPQQHRLLHRLARQNGGRVALLVQQLPFRFPPGFVSEVSTGVQERRHKGLEAKSLFPGNRDPPPPPPHHHLDWV